MNLGTRPVRKALRAPLNPAHWQALAAMARIYPRFPENLWRYVLGRGSYPYECAARTPTGPVKPTLYSKFDLLTMNEIFCREDYAAGRDVQAVVDIGANIGLAALYFLTRNTSSRVYCYEPVPLNVDRLRSTLAAHDGRYAIEQVAVADHDGEARFRVEDSGRYGRLDDSGSLTVRCRDINSVISQILAHEQRISILKIDTEGTEADLVRTIDPRLLDRIDVVVYETTDARPPHADRFVATYRVETMRLVHHSRQ